LSKQVHEAEDEGQRFSEALDLLTETLTEKRAEVELLGARVKQAANEYADLREVAMAETAVSSAETERLERELQGVKNTAQGGVLQLEQRLQATSMEYDQLVHLCEGIREEVQAKVAVVLDDVLKVKSHVEEGLEMYRGFVDEMMQQTQVEEVGGGGLRSLGMFDDNE
jgi:kinetochore protein NDC80